MIETFNSAAMEPKQLKQYDFSEEDRYLRAKKRVNQIKGFYWHLFWYLVINIMIFVTITKNLESLKQLNFGHFSTAFFWGIGLAAHWASVFGRNLIFSKNWEERKIREFMDKDDLKF